MKAVFKLGPADPVLYLVFDGKVDEEEEDDKRRN